MQNAQSSLASRSGVIRKSPHPAALAAFTDVHRPGKFDGVALARMVRQRRPDVLIVVTSGVMKVQREDIPEGGRFIPKPYDGVQVAGLISESLAQKKAQAGEVASTPMASGDGRRERIPSKLVTASLKPKPPLEPKRLSAATDR